MMLFLIKLFFLKQKWAPFKKVDNVVPVIAWFILLVFLCNAKWCHLWHSVPLPSALFLCLSAATGQISVLAFVLTSLCPVFSVLWLFSLLQNCLIGDWHKLTSLMAKFGLDRAESSAKTKTAVLFMTEVPINPALQAGYEVFYFCYYLCRCDIKAELPVEKRQQLSIVCSNVLFTLTRQLISLRALP